MPIMGEIPAFAHAQRRRGLSPNTIVTRVRTLSAFRAWLGAPLCDADAETVEKWLDSCRLGPRARSTYLTSLSAYYRWAMRTGVAEHDPVTEIDRPRLSRLLPHPIPKTDLAVALQQAPPRMFAWLALGAFEGLRCHEIADLRRECILEGREPPLLIVRKGKGGKDRVLPLNATVEAALHRYGLRQGYIFQKSGGRPLRPKTVSAHIGTYLHDLGIPFSAHALRHFFASELYRQTRDLRLVQEMLGHSRTDSTSVYVAFDPADAYPVVRDMTVNGTFRLL